MTTESQNLSALVISGDQSIVETILSNNTSDQEFVARPSVDDVLNEPALLENNAIIIYDINSAGDDVNKAIDQAIQIKKADPTQVLMLVGEKEPLGQILKSNIQPLVYRAFNKPISPNQLMLAFKSAHTLNAELKEKQAAGEDIMTIGPAENRTTIDSLAADRKTNPAIYAGIGVVVLGVLAFLFLGGSEEESAPRNIEQIDITLPEELQIDESEAVSRTNELNQQAEMAMIDGRFVSPKGDNALEYYDQVLAIDPYDQTAYDGRKQVADALRLRYEETVAAAQFDKAYDTLAALRSIDPLNTENDTKIEELQKAIASHVKKVQESGSAEEVAATTAVLDRLGSDVEGSQSAAAALKAEQALLARIDKALQEGNLAPPQKDNAYSLVSDALKANKISKTNSEPRVKDLSSQLLALANTSFEEENTDATGKYIALVKRLNVDRAGLAALNKKIATREEELAAAKAEEEKAAEPVEEAAPEPPKIIPAKMIARPAPKYPPRALKKDIEGWVKVRFDIDDKGQPVNISVVEATPEGTFDDAAMRSVAKWRFSPARNQNTGLPVESKNITTKVQFRLN